MILKAHCNFLPIKLWNTVNSLTIFSIFIVWLKQLQGRPLEGHSKRDHKWFQSYSFGAMVLSLLWSVGFLLSANVQPIVFAFLPSGGSCFSISSHGVSLQTAFHSRAQLSPLTAFSPALWLPAGSPCVSFLLCMKCTANSYLCSVYFMVSCLLFGVLRAWKSSISCFLL